MSAVTRRRMARSEGPLSLPPGPIRCTLELAKQRDRPAGPLHQR